MILDYRKLRRAGYVYAHRNDLGKPGKYPKEKGITAESHLPPGKPYRAFLLRLQKHMHAQHPKNFPAKYVDGTFNRKTRLILAPPKVVTFGQKLVQRAIREVGTHEYPWGSNSGARVHFYQSSTGAYNAAWCASFVCKMAQEVGYKGSVSAGAWDLTDNHGKRVKGTATALPGDVVSLNTGQGHVGILLRVNRTLGTVTLIAGNTGDSVKQKDYPISIIHSICRLG
jgi:hypothetical protein